MIHNNRKMAPLTLPRIVMKKSGLSVSNPSYFPRKTRLQMPRKHGLRAKWEKALKKSGNGQSVHSSFAESPSSRGNYSCR